MSQDKYIAGQVPIRPLTHCNRQGEVYQRSDQVTAQIQAALVLAPAHLISRAQIQDFHAPDYLQEECLVYLIREYRKEGATEVVNQLSQVLLRRCAKYINDRLMTLDAEYAEEVFRDVEEAFRDVIEALFSRILDLKSDRGDFLQVRFWMVVERLTVSTFGAYLHEQRTAKNVISLSSLAGNDPEEETGEHRHRREVAAPLSFLEQTPLIRDALHTLEERHRIAFVLRHYEGWQIEASDPSEPNISKYFGKSPRTIRTWLAKAEETIQQWRGEES